jgi:hypothetical protein
MSEHCTACGYREGHAPECQKQWATPSEQPDTEPRTEAGKHLLALLAEYQVQSEHDYPDKERRTAAGEAYRDARQTVAGMLDRIEAEARATRSPDVPDRFRCEAIGCEREYRHPGKHKITPMPLAAPDAPSVALADVEDAIFAVADSEQYDLQYWREVRRLAKDVVARLSRPSIRTDAGEPG